MSINFTRLALLFPAFLACAASTRAQVIIPTTGVVREEFNSMAAGTTLPTGWKVNSTAGAGTTALSYISGTTGTLTQAASSGSPTTGGSYNWGTTAGTNRAVGFMTSGGFSSPNAVLVQYHNSTGQAITSLTLTYKLERYRINTSAFSMSLYSSATGNGGAWTAQAAGDVSTAAFPAGASAYTFSTPKTVYKTVTIGSLNIAANADYYFMWLFNNAGSTNSQGIGLDDVVLFAGTGAPNISATLDDALITDINGNGVANEGDSLGYKARIQNRGNANALNTTYTNSVPGNTAMNSGTIVTSALGNDDSYTTPVNTNLSGTTVLSNDAGVPSPTVASFGPMENAAQTIANGSNTVTTDNGGTVVMNTNGTFTYAPPAQFAGQDRFAYTAANGNPPNNDAVVNVNVGSVLTGLADAYSVTGNVPIQVPAANGVLANDGNSGNGSSVLTVNGAAANIGVVVATANGGSVTVAADGSFLYKPLAGYEGADNFTYTADNAFGSPTASVTVTLTIANSIWFVDNTGTGSNDGRLGSPFQTLAAFQALNDGIGNHPAPGDVVFIYSGSGNYTGGLTLLSNQKLIGQGASGTFASATGITPATSSITVPAVAGTAPTINGTSVAVTLNNSGTVNTINGVALSTASSVSLSGSGFGTLTVSNTTINNGSAAAIALTNGTVNGTFTSVSSGGGSTNAGFTNCSGNLTISGGSLSGATGTAFTVSGGSISIINAGNIAQSNNAALVSVSGGHSGTLTFQTGTLNATNGTGLQFDNADGTYNFSGSATLSGGDAGIDIINGSAGNFTFANAPITNPSGHAIQISGSTAIVNHSGAIAHSAAAFRAVNLSGNTGGSVTLSGNITLTGSSNGINISTCSAMSATFSGNLSSGVAQPGITVTSNATSGTYTFSGNSKSFSTGPASAIILTTNPGITVNFSGGGLAIATTSGTGFNATGGAAGISVTGTGNTINASAATALNVNGTTISASGLNFQSISSGSGSNTTATGIILDNTGSNGGLTVTGTGSAGSGGTIQHKTGADGSFTTGCGIYLNSTKNASFTRMQLNDFQNNAVAGNAVNGFTFNNCVVSGSNGDNANVEDATVYFTNLTGAATMNSSNIGGTLEDGVKIINSSGSLNPFTMDGTTIGLNSTTLGDNGFLLQAQSTASITATIQNSVFSGARGDMFQFDLANTATGNLTFYNNTCINNHTAIVTGGGGISISGGGSSGSSVNLVYDINNNTFRNARGDAILVALQTGGGLFTGKIRNNTIGLAGTNQSGSLEATAVEVRTVGSGNQVVLVNNNTIRQYSNFGVLIQTGGQTANGNGTAGSMHATISNNTIGNPSSYAFIKNGIQLNSGTNSGDAFSNCMDIRLNNVTGSGDNGGVDIQVRQRFTTTVRLPGYSGANNSNSSAASYVQSLNNGCPSTCPTVTCTNTVSTGGGGFVGGAACTQP